MNAQQARALAEVANAEPPTRYLIDRTISKIAEAAELGAFCLVGPLEDVRRHVTDTQAIAVYNYLRERGFKVTIPDEIDGHFAIVEW